MEKYDDFFSENTNYSYITEKDSKLSDNIIKSMKVFCYANYPNCNDCPKKILCEYHFHKHPPFAGTKDY